MHEPFLNLKPGPAPKPVALRIELLGIQPLIWRRIVVSNQSTLAALHNYMQWVMGWQNSHAHEFHIGDFLVAPDWWIAEMAHSVDVSQYKDETRFSVAKVLAELGVGGEFEYHYDMGDGWQHRVVIERPPAASDFPLPRCTAGENACPPEDVGGPHGYVRFLEILADPKHEQHTDMLQWAGGVFDPKGFDLNRLNRDWRGKKKSRR